MAVEKSHGFQWGGVEIIEVVFQPGSTRAKELPGIYLVQHFINTIHGIIFAQL